MMIEHQKENLVIGLISDTHGLFRSEINSIFAGVNYILHAGDIGDRAVLDHLEKIAPVLAVPGNNDSRVKFTDIYDTAIFKTACVSIYIIHDIGNLDLDPLKAGFNAVVYGHTHIAAIHNRYGSLFINPGSAGPRRFSLPVTVGKLSISGDKLEASIINLNLDNQQ